MTASKNPRKSLSNVRVPLFSLGRTVATPGALEAFIRTTSSPSDVLSRHQTGDWGDVCPDDKRANDLDVKQGGRILSVYHLRDGTKLYCITEWDRSQTTLLLPSEY